MEDKGPDMAVLSRKVQAIQDRIDKLEKGMDPAFFFRFRCSGSQPRFGTVRCSSKLPKGELIHLFFILMEEEVFFFDPVDKKKNRSMFQDFIGQNFTYSGEGGRQHAIARVSRHFSECAGFTYREQQLAYLEKIIALLNSRKERLEGR